MEKLPLSARSSVGGHGVSGGCGRRLLTHRKEEIPGLLWPSVASGAATETGIFDWPKVAAVARQLARSRGVNRHLLRRGRSTTWGQQRCSESSSARSSREALESAKNADVFCSLNFGSRSQQVMWLSLLAHHRAGHARFPGRQRIRTIRLGAPGAPVRSSS